MAEQTRNFDLEISWNPQRETTRRALITIAVLTYFVVGFRVVPMLSASRATTLRTFLDDRIPFLPWTVYFYAAVYVAGAYPVFVVRCPRLFDRTMMAYTALLTASFLCYLVFPVTSIGFRPDPSTLNDRIFHEWGLKLNYALDEPYNLFPSLHLSIVSIAMLSAWKASARLGALALPLVAAVAVAIFTLKQHYLADGIAALCLTTGIYYLFLKPYPARQIPERERSYGRRGAATYLAVHTGIYLALYVAFRCGLKVW